MKPTTADFRKSAQEFERLCMWLSAASMWEHAIAAYPNPAGGIAKLDIARMQQRAAACKGMREEAA